MKDKMNVMIACDRIFRGIEDPITDPVCGLITIKKNKFIHLEFCNKNEYQNKLKHWKQTHQNLKDHSGKVISPAFINAHTHIAMNLFRGIDRKESTKGNMVEDLFYHIESRLNHADVLAFARIGAWENLLNGNGFIWDHYYFGDAIASALSDTGLCGVVAPTLQDIRGPGQHRWEEEWSNTLGIHDSEFLSEQGIYAALGPHATDTVSENLWKKIFEMAPLQNLPVHSHHSQSAEEYNRCLNAHNCQPGEWLRRMGGFEPEIHHLLVHNVYVKKTDLKLYKKKNIALAFCPFSSLIFAQPSKVMDWESKGLKWTIGTDCVASNDSMNLQKELKYLSGAPMQSVGFSQAYGHFFRDQNTGVEATISRRTKLWSRHAKFRDPNWLLNKVWSVPGTIHPRIRVGQISEGSLANLIVWNPEHPSLWPFQNLDSLAMGDNLSAIHNLLCAGQWIGKIDGQFHSGIIESPTYKEHLKEARERFALVLKKCGLS